MRRRRRGALGCRCAAAESVGADELLPPKGRGRLIFVRAMVGSLIACVECVVFSLLLLDRFFSAVLLRREFILRTKSAFGDDHDGFILGGTGRVSWGFRVTSEGSVIFENLKTMTNEGFFCKIDSPIYVRALFHLCHIADISKTTSSRTNSTRRSLSVPTRCAFPPRRHLVKLFHFSRHHTIHHPR